jgi:hypothetical protein
MVIYQSSRFSSRGFTFQDFIFVILVISALVMVTFLGHEAYLDAMKTEITKKNGEELASWLTESGTLRFKKDYDVAACAGGKPPTPAAKVDTSAAAPVEGEVTGKAEEPNSAPESVQAGTWGACFEHLLKEGVLKDMVNPFTNEAPQFIAACNPADHSLAGQIALEKLTPTPPGSAVPIINSQLVDTDPIDQKLQLRLSVCDKGAYAIKIAEFEY